MRYCYASSLKTSLDENGLQFYYEWNEKHEDTWDMPALVRIANYYWAHQVFIEAAFSRLCALNFVKEMELCDTIRSMRPR